MQHMCVFNTFSSSSPHIIALLSYEWQYLIEILCNECATIFNLAPVILRFTLHLTIAAPHGKITYIYHHID